MCIMDKLHTVVNSNINNFDIQKMFSSFLKAFKRLKDIAFLLQKEEVTSFYVKLGVYIRELVFSLGISCVTQDTVTFHC